MPTPRSTTRSGSPSACKATVVGLHVLDIVSIEGSFLHDVSGSLGFEPYLDFSSKMREALQERGPRAPRRLPAALHRAAACPATRSSRLGIDRQRDLRPGPHRRPGGRRPSRRQRAVLDRAPRRHHGIGDAQVPEAGPGHAARIPPDHHDRSSPTTAPSARAPPCTPPPSWPRALGLPLTVVHVAKDNGGDATAVLDEARRYLASLRGLDLTVPSRATGAAHQAHRRRHARRAATICSSSAPTATAGSSRWCSAARPSTCCATAPAPSSCRGSALRRNRGRPWPQPTRPVGASLVGARDPATRGAPTRPSKASAERACAWASSRGPSAMSGARAKRTGPRKAWRAPRRRRRRSPRRRVPTGSVSADVSTACAPRRVRGAR